MPELRKSPGVHVNAHRTSRYARGESTAIPAASKRWSRYAARTSSHRRTATGVINTKRTRFPPQSYKIGGHCQRRHRVLVPESVDRDRHAGRKSVEHRRSSFCIVQAMKAGRQEDTHDDDDDTCGRNRRRALAEKNNGCDRRKQRSSSACQRIDDGKLAESITTLQDDEVDHVQDAVSDDERNVDRRNRSWPEEDHGKCERGINRRRDRERQPDKRRACAGTFCEQIPRRVEDRGREDESESE